MSKYTLQHFMKGNDWVKYVGLDKECFGCNLRSNHDFPCDCELASHEVGSIPLYSIHVIRARLIFSKFHLMSHPKSC